MTEYTRPDPVAPGTAAAPPPLTPVAPAGATSAGAHPAQRWNGRTTAVAAAVAVGLATLGGGAVAYAAPAVDNATQGGPGGHMGGPGGMGGPGRMGGPGGMGGPGQAPGGTPGQQGTTGQLPGGTSQQGTSQQGTSQQGAAQLPPGVQGQ